ncbi:baseplate wedge protein [Ochrobactrum phage vB_OspM_OC]|nr:baseplate wedge protein [Ochrobactrum phage vB_OspM_OC]
MATYFEEFPKVSYKLEKSTITLTNIFEAFKVKSDVFAKIQIFFEYHIQDGETPEIVAHKLYGDISLEWIILMFNKIHDPYFDWPMSYSVFEKYLATKYGSIEQSTQQTHHYEWIVFKKTYNDYGEVIPEKVIIVDEKTYLGLDASDRREIKCYDYEVALNEKRRSINVPDSRYITQLIAEKQRVFNR